MSAMKHLVAGLWHRSLKIRVGNDSEAFASPDELVAFLSTRILVPSERMQEFAGFDARALKREARKMLQAHQNVMDVMASAKETGESLSSLWRRFDISKVPDDHDWPSILFALGNAQHISEDYQRQALAQYLVFLETRRHALDGFRQHPKAAAAREAPMTAVPHRGPEDKMSIPSHGVPLDDYSRLPHCHVVEVDLEEKPDITVFLGANRYHLVKHGEVAVLRASDAGGDYPLKPGRNTIGRSTHCDVHLDAQHADISRQHLIVEINGQRRITLTDVSSRGTYVRPELLGSTRSDTLTEQQ